MLNREESTVKILDECLERAKHEVKRMRYVRVLVPRYEIIEVLPEEVDLGNELVIEAIFKPLVKRRSERYRLKRELDELWRRDVVKYLSHDNVVVVGKGMKVVKCLDQDCRSCRYYELCRGALKDFTQEVKYAKCNVNT